MLNDLKPAAAQGREHSNPHHFFYMRDSTFYTTQLVDLGIQYDAQTFGAESEYANTMQNKLKDEIRATVRAVCMLTARVHTRYVRAGGRALQGKWMVE